ncbi:hypothetical protein ASE36_16525 [Rhizobium sp. Root274]|uniref:hypothetical protein n=1 Tax=unclassified Rhizobium TaxID=2613769 RepID=UPI000713187D|nr:MULTISPECIES: hypothetical protein [unclassified Rhizobium]KQW28055.1 hypothetical protein ASC71_16560 [Rhizobium sp. Root1240]KRD28339.1 hypothetical protein ASE36_16525 [Rhizobium sp. Root274]
MGATVGASVLLAALALPYAALAADCRIEKATYREAETGLELVFEAASGENTPVTHGFSTTIGKLKLNGYVMYDAEIERPVGMLMNNCPEGDVTGADLAACTVWKGIVYGIDTKTGHVDLLPPEGADAPDALLLPGFGPSVIASSAGKGLETSPWDVFEFKGCAA